MRASATRRASAAASVSAGSTARSTDTQLRITNGSGDQRLADRHQPPRTAPVDRVGAERDQHAEADRDGGGGDRQASTRCRGGGPARPDAAIAKLATAPTTTAIIVATAAVVNDMPDRGGRVDAEADAGPYLQPAEMRSTPRSTSRSRSTASATRARPSGAISTTAVAAATVATNRRWPAVRGRSRRVASSSAIARLAVR